jgi:hypothetical protein
MAVTSLSFLFLLLISFPGGVSDLLTRFLLEAFPTVGALPLPDPSPLDVERFIAGDDVRDESDDDIMAFPALRGIAPDFSGVPILEELELILCFPDFDLF